MTVQKAGPKRFLPAGGRATAVRVLASVGVVTALAASAAPAHADTTQDSFLNTLNNAGVGYNDPGAAVAMGQSICPMLAQPGGSFASVASGVAGNGMSPAMSGMFTSIAISMFCPAMMTSLANGSWANAFPIPGLGG
ncbi:MAG: hypothetical protein JWR32_6000 [Mycobacterium sp.]|jgi:hypothetical protein|nr:hypothetical protein [Mycobacterium sp.]